MKILKLRLMEQMAYQNGLVFVYETYPSPLKWNVGFKYFESVWGSEEGRKQEGLLCLQPALRSILFYPHHWIDADSILMARKESDSRSEADYSSRNKNKNRINQFNQASTSISTSSNSALPNDIQQFSKRQSDPNKWTTIKPSSRPDRYRVGSDRVARDFNRGATAVPQVSSGLIRFTERERGSYSGGNVPSSRGSRVR